MILKKTKEWIGDKPEFESAVSAMLVINAEAFYSFLYHLGHNKDFANLFSVDNFFEWNDMYTKGLSFNNLFQSLDTPSITKLPWANEAMESIANLKEEAIAEGASPKEITDFIITYFIDNYEVENEEEANTSEAIKNISFIKNMPSLIFFFKVFLPCIIDSRKFPTQLLKETISGNQDSLEDLLKIDKTVLSLPGIKEKWEHKSRYVDDIIFNKLV